MEPDGTRTVSSGELKHAYCASEERPWALLDLCYQNPPALSSQKEPPRQYDAIEG